MTNTVDHQIEFDIVEARGEDKYKFENPAVSDWHYEQFMELEKYVRARIGKRDKGLVDSYKTANQTKLTDLAILRKIEIALDDLVEVGTHSLSDTRYATDKFLTIVGKPLYKRFLNALRVKKSTKDSQAVIKTTVQGKYCVKRAEETAKELGIDMPKGEFIELMLGMAELALKSYKRAAEEENEGEAESERESRIAHVVGFSSQRQIKDLVKDKNGKVESTEANN
ncbi:hypothetical protein ACOW3R_004351 [Vibrio vulnificus]